MRVAKKVVIDMETGAELAREAYEYSGPVDLCRGEDKPVAQQAQASATQQQQQNQQMFGQLQQQQGLMLPQYMSMLNNPAANSPEGQAAAASFGSAQDTLANRAARTGNSAGTLEAEDQLARDKANTLSDLTLKERQGALSGLQGMYGTNANLYARALGVPVEYLNTSYQAAAPKGPQGWDTLNSIISGAGQVGAAALGA